MIHSGGDMWWDLSGSPEYEVPKGSGKHSMFVGAMWFGGLDGSGNLHVAAQRYRMSGVDFWPGPLNSSAEVTPDVCSAYDQLFVTYRDEVETFVNWYNSDPETQAAEYPGYEIPASILNWPGNGDQAAGYDYYLAPFFDYNLDGAYNPEDGDYPYYDLTGTVPCGFSREDRFPRLYGDQNIWWVFNDKGNTHGETFGDAIGLEIRAQAFALSTEDEVNNCTFYKYEVINRSTHTYTQMVAGMFADADLGSPWDDFVGTDVQRGMGYFFNQAGGDLGAATAYGDNPPAVGIDFFEGPYMINDGIDNAAGCNESVNGLNFGDGIADNERSGLNSSMYYSNSGGVYPETGDPGTAYHYYMYLQSIWTDASHLVYGGCGYFEDPVATSTETKFMFPGTSDPRGFGQNGTPMPAWDEITTENTSGDRRLVLGSGSFTMEPGQVEDFSYGVVWARGVETNSYPSVAELNRADDLAQVYFDNCFRVTDSPDAPEMEITTASGEFLFNLFNTINSNNYLEGYHKKDYTMLIPEGLPDCDSFYTFQGYQVYQVTGLDVRVSELTDETKARLVYQCDLADGIGDLYNYSNNMETGVSEPKLMVDAADEGIGHVFTAGTDLFTGLALDPEVNYYYMAIAYAHNDYLHYNPTDPGTLYGQRRPYKPSRRTPGMNHVKVYETNPDAVYAEELPVEIKISVYPNPVTDVVYVKSESSLNLNLTIYDIHGKELRNFVVREGLNTIDMSDFSKGIYYLNLEKNGKKEVHKIVRQ